MRRKKGVIELAVSGAMPFAALVLIGLANFVSFGFKMPDTSFWIDTVINTVALLCFFLPFKTIFMEKYIADERILAKQSEYSALVGKVYNDKLIAFQDWTEDEFNTRRERVIRISLKALRMRDAEQVFDSYGQSIARVRRDSSLSAKQKSIIIRLIRKLSSIRQINADECLPGIEKDTQDNRVSSSMRKAERKQTVLKVLRSLAICAGIAMLTFTTDFSDLGTRYMPIFMALGLKLLIGLWHIYGASRLAHSLVNKEYFNELSEKSLVLTEFLESNTAKTTQNTISSIGKTIE